MIDLFLSELLRGEAVFLSSLVNDFDRSRTSRRGFNPWPFTILDIIPISPARIPAPLSSSTERVQPDQPGIDNGIRV